MFWHLGFAGPAEPEGQTYATGCRAQLNIADSQQKVYTDIHCMYFVADSVTHDACSAVASAVLTLEKWQASCCAKLVLRKSLHILL